MQATAEKVLSKEVVKPHNEVFNFELANRDVVCYIDFTTTPPTLKPFQKPHEHRLLPQNACIAELQKFLPDHTLTNKEILPVFRNAQDSKRASDVESDQQPPATFIYDVRPFAPLEAVIRQQASNPESGICIIPANILRRWHNRQHWQEVLNAIQKNTEKLDTAQADPESVDIATELEQTVAELTRELQQATTLKFNFATKTFIFNEDEVTEDDPNIRDVQFDEGLRILENVAISTIIPRTERQHFNQAQQELIVRLIEKAEEKWAAEGVQHRLLLRHLDELEQVIDDKALLADLRKILIQQRLQSYLGFHLGGALTESAITAGSFAGGIASSAAIAAILGHTVFLDYGKEEHDKQEATVLQEALTTIVEQIYKNYSHDIGTTIPKQLGSELKSVPKRIADANLVYSELVQVWPSIALQTGAMMGTEHYYLAGAYLAVIIGLRLLLKRGIGESNDETKIQTITRVAIKNLPSLGATLTEKLTNDQTAISAIVPLIINSGSRLLTRPNNQEEVLKSREAVQQLMGVVEALQRHSTSLIDRTAKDRHSTQIIIEKRSQKPDLEQLPKKPPLHDGNEAPATTLPEHTTYFESIDFIDFPRYKQEKLQLLCKLFEQVKDDPLMTENYIVILLSVMIDADSHTLKPKFSHLDSQKILELENVDVTEPEKIAVLLLEITTNFTNQELEYAITEVEKYSHTPTQKIEHAGVKTFISRIFRKVFGRKAQQSFEGNSKVEVKPFIKKRYQVLSALWGETEIQSPCTTFLDYSVGVGEFVYASKAAFSVPPETVAFVSVAPGLSHEVGSKAGIPQEIWQALEGTIASNGVGFVRTEDTDYCTAVDIDRPIIKHCQFEDDSFSQSTTFFAEVTDQADLFRYLEATSLFNAESLEIYKQVRESNSKFPNSTRMLRLKLFLAELAMQPHPVLILDGLFDHEIPQAEVEIIATFLQQLAAKKSIICSSRLNKPDQHASNYLLEQGKAIQDHLNGNKELVYAPPSLSELKHLFRKFKVPFSREEYVRPAAGIVEQAPTILTAQELALQFQEPFKPAEKKIDRLYEEITIGETKLHVWTLERLHQEAKERKLIFAEKLPPLTEANRHKEVILRETESVHEDIRYKVQNADGTTTELVLVELRQDFNDITTGEAMVDELGNPVFRTRTTKVGVLEKFNPTRETEEEAALRGMKMELNLTLTQEQLQYLGSFPDLKFSTTFQCLSIINFKKHLIYLTDEQYRNLRERMAILATQTEKVSIFGFIDANDIDKYHAGEIKREDLK